MNEELAKYHDNIGVVMVKFCIVVKEFVDMTK